MKRNKLDYEEPKIYLDLPDDEEIPDTEVKNKMNPVLKEVLDWAKHIVIAVAIGLFIVFFVVQRNEVVGTSMEPNLYTDDQLLVQKVTKLFPNGIAYGDIVTVDAEGLYLHLGDKNIIKRVIGLPGDTIDITDGHVYRNGIILEENYIPGVNTQERNTEYSHVLLDKNQYYILGDNREYSLDSRTFGPIAKGRIIGEVLIRFYPISSFGKP